jgi:uncharacterized protein YbaR (Trm112 family)
VLHSALSDCADILQCPITGKPLVAVEDGWRSADGQRHYPVDHGIPHLFAPVDPTMSVRDVTEMVKVFYEKTPSRIMMISIHANSRNQGATGKIRGSPR